jgi:4-amino-4-deoxy-L-arabinose transferase-like glycosyltransferase
MKAVAVSPVHSRVPNPTERKRGVLDRFAVLLIVFGWIAVAAIINPIGEMVINDDGAYAYAVRSVLETGSLKLSGWGSPNLFSQVYWGALFCLPFGFSYTALRLSTLTLALAALLALYGLMREAGAGSTTALFGVLTLALNPLFFELSFTYMTDVPFVGLALVATYLLVRGVRRQSAIELVLGLMAATAALLTRQTGLALFFALSLTYVVKNGLNKRNAIKVVAPALLGLGVQVSYQTWLKMTGRMPALFGAPAMAALDVKSMSMSYAITHLTSGVAFALMYVGLFTLPLLLFIGLSRLCDLWCQQRWIAILTSVMMFTTVAVQPFGRRRLPQVGNVLYDFGLGPVMVSYGTGTQPLPSAGPVFWKAVTVVSILAAALVLQVLINAVLQLVRTRGKHEELLLMLLAAGTIYFLPLPFVPTLYDRYFLLFLPLAIVVLFVTCSRGNVLSRRWTAVGVLCLLTYGAFAIAGTHDYLSLQRTRWQVLRTLTAGRRICPQRIDGGYEFNIEYVSPGQKWPVDFDLAISLGPIAGYAEVERHSFRRWLPPGEGTILVLQKITTTRILPSTR